MAERRDIDGKAAKGRSSKLFIWTAVAAILFGLVEFGSPLDDVMRVLRNLAHENEASGEIVLIEIDKKSVEELGAYPWPRSIHADIIDRTREAGAKSVYFDMVFAGRTTPRDDSRLVEAIRRAGNVTIAAVEERDRDSAGSQLELPLEDLQKAADLASINAYFNFQTAVWDLHYREDVLGKDIPSFASKMAGVDGKVGELFPIDYSIRYDSVPKVNVVDLLRDDSKLDMLRGKTAVVGISVMQLGDQVYIPGKGREAGVYVQILGAETLMRGRPVQLGWWPSLLVALLGCAIAVFASRSTVRVGGLVAAGATLALVPILTEAHLIFVDIAPGLFALAIVSSIQGYRYFQSRGFVNELSGLPNLVALRGDKRGKELPLIAARVHNFAEIVSTLNAEGERQLVEQIASRLGIGRKEGGTLYQGDEGIFAWFAEPRTAIGNHLEALHALFRSPVKIDQNAFDLTVSFGVEVGSGRSLANRLGSALVAADEADEEAIKWKYHDPARQQEVSWRLSLLSQLDEAIEQGQVWLAFQPKLELETKKLVGAEALARWTHPEKGPISPAEFIAAAEQHDRIGRLTDFVLANSIAAIADFSHHVPGFNIAINLSARNLTDHNLPDRVRSLLDRHGVAAHQLTLELTETAALEGSGADIDLLNQLRDMGVQISIDDYGTGLSTLDYLKKVPATEIKIDQSFVRGMRESRSDLIMVQSTIALAHSLDRKVVAEGVEDRDILDQLEMMRCDIVQGFIVGRPMGRGEMVRRLTKEKRQKVA
ncbi:EAL domain-containing protein [Sphingomicrobium lutaoense]|uniref:EAL domain-containing protein (Putative c-di-GMP-specific phosphodiesterase class I)/CHASE2 domain-containing sensor protein n=1 Tax=Sphingomicrobium lutaoense TaxID=515949 RepID=A0A839YWS6_9SPHN|nr:EAL domain-containing protein [Sphingomicrobium lutaoense]MBB3763486.1 EAL domain-containing protein (putative c-di-GMP-specific phosphodiesterase class I)/CHASE2 domain-containing sensor protein [Sphingomicrobium lutaoense]